jgi:cell wall-active antibiotic response 4TMS protein YvqF
LGTPLVQPQPAHAGAPVSSTSNPTDVPPTQATSLVPLDQAGASASGSTQPYAPDPGTSQRLRGPGGAPLGAVILIGLGVLLLLDNLGVLSFRWTAQFWPIVLIALGLWLAFRRMGMAQGRS